MGQREERNQGTPPNYVRPGLDWTLKGRMLAPRLYQESLGTSAQDSDLPLCAENRYERCEPRLAAARSRLLAVGRAAQNASQEMTRLPRDRAQCFYSVLRHNTCTAKPARLPGPTTGSTASVAPSSALVCLFVITFDSAIAIQRLPPPSAPW